MSTNPLNTLGEVVAEVMRQKGVSENRVALESGISRQTLRRRLRGGGFIDNELSAIGRILELPASELMALAEKRAA